MTRLLVTHFAGLQQHRKLSHQKENDDIRFQGGVSN